VNVTKEKGRWEISTLHAHLVGDVCTAKAGSGINAQRD
jgi:hypothetical protein